MGAAEPYFHRYSSAVVKYPKKSLMRELGVMQVLSSESCDFLRRKMGEEPKFLSSITDTGQTDHQDRLWSILIPLIETLSMIFYWS